MKKAIKTKTTKNKTAKQTDILVEQKGKFSTKKEKVVALQVQGKMVEGGTTALTVTATKVVTADHIIQMLEKATAVILAKLATVGGVELGAKQ